MQAHLGADARERFGQKVRRTHPGFERSEDVLDGLPAKLRGLGGAFKARLHALQDLFVLPACDASILAGGALGFQLALGTGRGPVLV